MVQRHQSGRHDQGRPGARRSRSPPKRGCRAWPDVPTLDELGFPGFRSVAMVGGLRAGRRAARDHRQAARRLRRGEPDAGNAGDLREGRHDRAGRQVALDDAARLAAEGNGDLAARHRRSPASRWTSGGNELENRNPARRRHRPRGRSGMRQGDEGRRRARPASPSNGSRCRSARPATSSTATRCRRSPRRPCTTLDGWIMGPIGHNAYPRGDTTWVMPPVRKKFDLFTALRPALSHPTIPSVHKNVDIVFFRELTEGMLYSETVVAGLPEFRPNDDITISIARHHPQRLEPRRARGLRARPHAPAQEGHRRAQGAGLSARLRHVRGGMPQGRASDYPDVHVRGDDDRLDRDEARRPSRSSSTWSSPPTSSATS